MTKRKTVLIVEDDDDIQDYLAILLRDMNLDILRARDGNEALALVDSGAAIDLILLDVIMPVMDGEEFFRSLRVARGSGVPVILTSVDEVVAGRLKSVGEVQGVFLKGERGEDLRALVASLLEKKTPS